MSKKENLSGTETTFKDKDGNAIKIHDYVKDAEGNRYYINSHCQAMPADGSDAPAVELARLISEKEVSIMSVEEVLNIEKPVVTRRRGGRRKKVEAEPGNASCEAAPESLEKAAAEAKEEDKDPLHPVTEEMILSVLPDNVLANELRRRGYTLCAVRPALIEL